MEGHVSTAGGEWSRLTNTVFYSIKNTYMVLAICEALF